MSQKPKYHQPLKTIGSDIINKHKYQSWHVPQMTDPYPLGPKPFFIYIWLRVRPPIVRMMNGDTLTTKVLDAKVIFW